MLLSNFVDIAEYDDDLEKDCGISSVLTMEIPQSWTNPSN